MPYVEKPHVIWVQFQTDVDEPVNLDYDDILDILHNLRMADIMEILDNKDIVVKLATDV